MSSVQIGLCASLVSLLLIVSFYFYFPPVNTRNKIIGVAAFLFFFASFTFTILQDVKAENLKAEQRAEAAEAERNIWRGSYYRATYGRVMKIEALEGTDLRLRVKNLSDHGPEVYTFDTNHMNPYFFRDWEVDDKILFLPADGQHVERNILLGPLPEKTAGAGS